MRFLFKSLSCFEAGEHLLLRRALTAHPSHPFSSALRRMKHHQVAQQKKNRLNAKQIKAFLVPEWNQPSASNGEASGKAANRTSLVLPCIARPPRYTAAAQDSACFSESPRRLRHRQKNLHLHFGGACDPSTQLAQVTRRAARWGHSFSQRDEPCCSPFARHSWKFRCMVCQAASVRTIIHSAGENNRSFPYASVCE